ncbi:MAG TPA: hypothetical protein VEW42_04880 [Candidatus Eisenbacteria bacterium]|nr:hypothetical protein [Candidatus Eisenbacteria bacterium]
MVEEDLSFLSKQEGDTVVAGTYGGYGRDGDARTYVRTQDGWRLVHRETVTRNMRRREYPPSLGFQENHVVRTQLISEGVVRSMGEEFVSPGYSPVGKTLPFKR